MKDYKKCTKCGEEKPATPEHFVKRTKSKDGFHSYCKICQAEYKKAHYRANKAHHAEYHKKWREKEENKEHLQEYRKRYYDTKGGTLR
tara:strand:- start:318 stop:581 length:264 start_codon:yes stop_codon:yes gene_type:complete